MKFQLGDYVLINRRNCYGIGKIVEIDDTDPIIPYVVEWPNNSRWVYPGQISLLASFEQIFNENCVPVRA